MFILMSHWSGSRLMALAHNHHWTLTQTSVRYPAGAPSHEDPVANIPQDQSLHMFQQVLDGVDVIVGQPKVKDVGFGHN